MTVLLGIRALLVVRFHIINFKVITSRTAASPSLNGTVEVCRYYERIADHQCYNDLFEGQIDKRDGIGLVRTSIWDAAVFNKGEEGPRLIPTLEKMRYMTAEINVRTLAQNAASIKRRGPFESFAFQSTYRG